MLLREFLRYIFQDPVLSVTVFILSIIIVFFGILAWYLIDILSWRVENTSMDGKESQEETK